MKNVKKNGDSRLLVVLVLLISIGFAAISTRLDFRGFTRLVPQSWDVYFENIVSESSSLSSAVVDSEDESVIILNLNLPSPGDSYSFYVDVVNDGTIDAMLDSFEIQDLSSDVQQYLQLDVTYLDGVSVSQYDLLGANSRETLKVTCTYSQDVLADDLPTTNKSSGLSLTVNYLQSDSNAQERQRGTISEGTPTLTKRIATTSGRGNWLTDVTFVYNIEDEEAVVDAKYCVATETCTPNITAPIVNSVFTYHLDESTTPKMVCVSATNVYGNTASECSDTYLVDSVAPQITNFTTTKDGNSIIVQMNATDETSGISTYYYSKDGGENFISSLNPNYTFTSLNEDVYFIVAYVEDEAGNKSQQMTSSVSFT